MELLDLDITSRMKSVNSKIKTKVERTLTGYKFVGSFD